MAENPTPEFEHNIVERDIEELEAEIIGRLESRVVEREVLKGRWCDEETSSYEE